MSSKTSTTRRDPSRPRRGRGLEQLKQLLERPVMQFMIFGAFLALLVSAMTAGFDMRNRSISPQMVGQPAPYAIKAISDFNFSEPDEEATDKLRETVAANVPPVYDWREGLGEQLREQVRASFRSMRGAMAEEIARQKREEQPKKKPATKTPANDRGDQPALLPNKPDGGSAEAGSSGSEEADPVSEPANEEAGPADEPALDVEALIDATKPSRRLQLARKLRAQHFDPLFPGSIRPDDFNLLARQGFSGAHENAISALLKDVMSNLIVEDLRSLEQQHDQGVYLRRMRGDKVLIEYHVADIRKQLLPRESMPSRIAASAQNMLSGELDANTREVIVHLVTGLIKPNTLLNMELTRQKRVAARNAVASLVINEQFRKGQVVVEKNQPITGRHLRIYQKMISEENQFGNLQILSGLALLAMTLLTVFFLFGRLNLDHFKLRSKDIYFLGTTLLLFMGITRLGKWLGDALLGQQGALAEAWPFVIPVAGFGMLVRLVLKSEHATMSSLAFALLVGVILDSSLFFATFAAIGCLAGASTVRQVKNRMTLMWSGLVIGSVNASLILAHQLLLGELLTLSTLVTLGLAFVGGLLSGFLVSALLPVFEASFGYTTDIKLLELANLNHPLLRDLIIRSPGSYHHSMMVGSLCEAACEAIGAHALLARVGAYYHDIGKMKNPQYFAENQKAGNNPHDRLKPNMSALIIKSHVKDGLEMARQGRLPKEIQDFIAQHHGTSLIAYFYWKAKKLEDPDIPEVDEKDYRYPGPKPQSRETAICLLADGIEAASRSMGNPTPAELKGLVQKMINKAFTDGQLDECDLTLKDLNSIAEAFTRILTGIYHHRPKYPGQDKKRSSANASSQETRSKGKNDTEPTRLKTTVQMPAVQSKKTSETSKTADDSDETSAEDNGEEEKVEASGETRAAMSESKDEPRASLPRLGAR